MTLSSNTNCLQVVSCVYSPWMLKLHTQMCSCIHAHTHTHSYAHTHSHTCTHSLSHTCTHTHTHAHTLSLTQTHTNTPHPHTHLQIYTLNVVSLCSGGDIGGPLLNFKVPAVYIEIERNVREWAARCKRDKEVPIISREKFM